VTLIVAVAGGMLLNEWVKVLVHRQRPFAHFLTDVLAAIFIRNYLAGVVRGSLQANTARRIAIANRGDFCGCWSTCSCSGRAQSAKGFESLSKVR